MRTMEIDVTIHLYKASSPTAATMDKLIAKYTNSAYSHCEIVVNTTRVAVRTDGVLITTDYSTDVDTGSWDVIHRTYVVTEKQYMDMMQFVYNQQGLPYDFTGIVLSQLIGLGISREGRWYCSELVCKILQLLGEELVWELEPHRVNPGDIPELLIGER
jgi:hypothetical protein